MAEFRPPRAPSRQPGYVLARPAIRVRHAAPRGSYARRRITGCCALYDLPDPARVDFILIDVIGVFEIPS